MPRKSAWSGNKLDNNRPYITIAPDAYVCIQGETYIIGCGECRKQINFNQYLTSVSTEASVDSPPGSASLSLTIPDTDINDFYAENELIIIPMMEVEIYIKGYFLIGGVPQYYKSFWGVISSVTKSWSNGVTTVSVSCKDILRWWELTMIKVNPSFLDSQGGTPNGYQLFQNQFAGMNPYTVIMALAKEAMGDWSQTVSSFTSNVQESGREKKWSDEFMTGIMLYWQAKFGNIWNNLVMYGASGNIYNTTGDGGSISTNALASALFAQEFEFTKDQTEQNAVVKLSPNQIAAFKRDYAQAGEVPFFQPDIQSKLTIALQARDQIGYEFYCDTSGDIVFKPPFYNLNVLPNKPISWIQDIDIIDDSISESEAEVYTHIVASGNAFGGVNDYGLNDEITTPRTGAFDYHLLKRYGWRKYDYPCEWAGDPRKLFFHILDFLDRLNAKRKNGTVTIPLRPEIKMGFPVWIPKYDSFFYVNGVSHSYSVGGQATTTLTLIAKRSKFLAPKNIGKISITGSREVKRKVVYKGDPKEKNKYSPKELEKPVTINTYSVTFPDAPGNTTTSNEADTSKPVILRHPKTGRLLGYPRVVMVYKKSIDGEEFLKLAKSKTNQKKTQNDAKTPKGTPYKVSTELAFQYINDADKAKLIARIRQNRYEAGASNAGAYDYAEDTSRTIKEFLVIPLDSITYQPDGPGSTTVAGSTSKPPTKEELQKQKDETDAVNKQIADLQKQIVAAQSSLNSIKISFFKKVKEFSKGKSQEQIAEILNTDVDLLDLNQQSIQKGKEVSDLQLKVSQLQSQISNKIQQIPNLSVIIRPVSDEFGFEVIGHYKYGRGSFIDQGKIKTSSTDGGTANQLNIQFSPTGGLLTDSVGVQEKDTVDFAKSFESMRPDDWATGATFQSNGQDKPSDFQVTSVNTYTADIMSSVGKSVFIEVDSTRKAKLLEELSPTLEIDNLSAAVTDCSCGIGKSSWISILPTSVIRSILASSGGAAFGSMNPASNDKVIPPNDNLSPIFTSAGKSLGTPMSFSSEATPNEGVVAGNIDSGSFIDALHSFLSDEFNRRIKDNQTRESIYSGESLGKTNPFADGPLTDNAYDSTTGGSLFDRAVSGDPQALQAVKNQVNDNFGLVKGGFDKLKDVVNKSEQKVIDSFNSIESTSNRVFNPKNPQDYKPNTSDFVDWTGWNDGPPPKQLQPPAKPSFQNIINPGKYAQSYISNNPVDPVNIPNPPDQ